MDAAILHQALKGDAGDLAAHRIKAGNDDCLRSIVNDDIHSGQRLKGPDVASLSADDASLHLVAGQADGGDGGVTGHLGGKPLDGRDDDVPGFLVGSQLRLGLDLIDLHLGVMAGGILHLRHDCVFRLVGGHAGNPLQLAGKRILTVGESLLPIVERVLAVSQLFLGILDLALLFLECLFLVLQAAFRPLQFILALSRFTFLLALFVQQLFARLKNEFVFLCFRFFYSLSIQTGSLLLDGGEFKFRIQPTGAPAQSNTNYSNQESNNIRHILPPKL